MRYLFTRARKALAAFVTGFVAALLTAAQAGTVFTFSPLGINWVTVAAAAALALGSAIVVWNTGNVPPTPAPEPDGGGARRPRLG